MVPIEKKPAPDDHESSLKIFLFKLFLPRCPCADFKGKKSRSLDSVSNIKAVGINKIEGILLF